MAKSMTGGHSESRWWTCVLLLIISVTLAACSAPAAEPQTPAQDDPVHFSARAESEDGAIVAWRGYHEGYEPGTEAEFTVEITNETAQNWTGRYCLQLLGRESHAVLTTLEQRPFTLEPGVGFTYNMTVRLPESLDDGAYGLSLAVRRPGGPMVDLVSIQVGETDEIRRATTRQDLNASLAACPPVETMAEQLIALAKTDLAGQLGISPDQIEVLGVEPAEFPDASLGVPEPGQVYAQMITPGYIIELAADEEIYRYHGSEGRIVEAPRDSGQPPAGDITIEGVQVTSAQVVVRGSSTLPDEACLNSELLAGGTPETWWPGDHCARIQQGEWELLIPLESEQALQPDVQYTVRVFLPGGPNIVSTFLFDLDSPPTPQG
jgi:hypothetical protein